MLRVAVGTRLNDNGKPVAHRRDVGLGSYPEVSLAEAREKARELRKQIRGGIDPIEQKKHDRETLRVQHSKAKTFRECVEVVIANKSRELKNAKHVAQWQSTLETYAYPTIVRQGCGQRSQQLLQPGACIEGFDARSDLTNSSAIGDFCLVFVSVFFRLAT